MYKFSRIAVLILGLLFVLFAAVNLNDHDWYIWIPIYLYASTLCVLSFYEKGNIILNLLSMLLYMGGGIYLWPEKYMGITMPMSYAEEVELARESLGLAICGVAIGISLFVLKEKNSFKEAKNKAVPKEKVVS